MSEAGQKVAIVTGGSRGIGAGLVGGYRQRRWAVVANSLNIKPPKDPDVRTVKGDNSEQATADQRAIGQMLKQRSGHVVNISASVADRADSVEPTALVLLVTAGRRLAL